jgi:LmbE family N-acetylglucosaminyl deacetylase
MRKKLLFSLLFLTLYINQAYPVSTTSLEPPSIKTLEPIKKDDRILILAPHPDDETIGCAGIIQEAVRLKAKIQVVYLTNGDHNQFAFIVYEKRPTFRKSEFIHMGEVRRREAIKAMKLLGLNENNLVFLGYPDFGTFTIFSKYWQDKKPFRSLLTRISSVPYKENLSFGAPYIGGSILNDLKKVLLDYKPNKIFVSHPADTNVDHKALYLFLQIALRDLDKLIPEPRVYPYFIHCVGWPLPRHYHPQLSLMPPKQFLDSQIDWFGFTLTPEQLSNKHQAILCYKSQTESSAFYLLSFARQNELFGDYLKIELKKQASLKNQKISSFNSSNMFTDSVVSELGNLENFLEGKGQVSYDLRDDSLLIRIDKTKKLDRRFSIMLYLFGYSYKTPFAQMPKISIITKHDRFKVLDARKLIKPEGVNLELNAKSLVLKIPLKILGEPDFVLSSVKTYAGVFPVDAISFRKINIK